MPVFFRPVVTTVLLGALYTVPALLSIAQADTPHYNQISLRAEVGQEIPRDRMHVTLYTEVQGTDPAALAAGLTQTLNQSLAAARKTEGVEVSLGSRNSYPLYDEKGQTITGWRERGEIRLQSSDFASLSRLTAELLGDLKMGGMEFSVADTTRKKSENSLIKAAVDAFKARAELTTQALGGSGYKLVNLTLNTNQVSRPIPMLRAKSMMAESAPVQDIEAGTSEVSVSADGTIEVQMP
ncbi:putative secreted protein [Pseudomonas duriflava]|uniref:Putative secreted protein n=1 Tax=Pseudomonas duriflava TaxID=459528 RepID=A0A562QCG2_9PSED|nr:SIMPL domain-containing protein [Pseudomonas duriflava]TWI54403.1 putative secreted protein [Pseudomonas duriflava]